MTRLYPLLFGSAAAAAMVVLGLWAWAQAPRVGGYADASRPEIVSLAVRAAAGAGIATGQLVLWYSLGRVFPRWRFDRAVLVGLGLVAASVATCAITLALAGR